MLVEEMPLASVDIVRVFSGCIPQFMEELDAIVAFLFLQMGNDVGSPPSFTPLIYSATSLFS